MGYIERAKLAGGKVITGGNKVGGPSGVPTNFIEPTIFVDVREDSELATDEIFGPVMCVFSFKDTSDCIERINNSKYGLWASVHTDSLNNAAM